MTSSLFRCHNGEVKELVRSSRRAAFGAASL
jgi:hypothetical protein